MLDSESRRGGTGADERRRSDRAVATLRSLAVVALVVTATALAGCGMLPGGGDDGEAAAQIDAPRAVAEPLDPSASDVFQRVEEIAGVDGTAPEVRTTSLATTRNLSNPYVTTLVGLPDQPSTLTGPVNVSYSAEDDVVYVNEETVHDMDASEIEASLAYGFGVALHYQQEWIEADAVRGYDERAVVFGTTRTVANAYADEHLDRDYYAADSFERASAYQWAVYGALQYHGQEYVDSVTDSPSDIASIYEDGAPETSEQLLHDTDEALTPLSVDVTSSNWWTEERPPYRVGTFGELGTRAFLRSQLSAEEAAAAADGWGNDSAATFTSVQNESVGTVWVHRWDSEAEADEFAGAAEAFADARQSSANVTMNVTRPAPDTTILVAHRGNFRNNAEITYEDGTLTVAVGESS